MSRLAGAFEPGRPALIPFVTVGDPSLDATVECVIAMAAAGAAVVELGIPFSDPIADGPTIASASFRALSRGVRIDDVFDVVARIRERTAVPLVLFTYCNPVFKYGAAEFMARAANCGADAVLLPDLPFDESAEMRQIAQRNGLDVIHLVAPTTTPDRLARIGAGATGFLYLVAALGVTGARAELKSGLAEQIRRARAASRAPVAVGFGVSTPEQAAQLAAWGADGVIVGSALVQRLHEWREAPDLAQRAGAFVAGFASAPAAGSVHQP
ncbi:MAG: tryptophan synthase subunit alpha [Candidatus Sericytochromatia bacterium]|nr:tryptophan synthase subunit alpha [Candidatus Tanganyikabacteria bacterium]